MKELIVRMTGAVQEQNLDEFEQSAMAVLNSINTELVTDEDFAAADQATKDCKLVETRIANAKTKALHEIEDISKLFTLMDKLSDKFRDVRLGLEKKVKNEKEHRKADIVNGYRDRISATITAYPCAHAFDLNRIDFNACVKGKRSLTEMRKACESLYIENSQRLADTIVLWGENQERITAAESEFPGLFPDRRNLAIEPAIVVESAIESRIAKHKLAIKEKAEREEAARLASETAKKAEAERIEAAKAKQVEEPQPPAAQPIVAPPAREALPPCNVLPPVDLPPPPSFDDEVYTIMVEVTGTRAIATAIANHVRTFADVTDVTVVEGYAVKCGE